MCLSLSKKPLKHPKAPKGFLLVCESYIEGPHERAIIPYSHYTLHASSGLEVETVGSTGVAYTLRCRYLKQGPVGYVC
ncbi:XRE family transcriptional regulator [Enterobacter phage EcpYZU01]|uniref:XRE family transcriptional regulator n=1 Tax=Enterobacter phage EcpYZU01 TaxID=2483604 RepID=UPI0018ACBDFD|nr:XRE family transcriptional regulator [Enterobacter phage EcpYZU01]